MNFKKILSIIIGFGTIGLLSSVFATIQGILFPASVQLFNQASWSFYDIIQLVVKLMCVYLSCIAGGIVTSLCGGENKQLYIVGILITLVIIWLWISTVHVFWFWTLLIIGSLPFVFLGAKIKRQLFTEQ
ncbi:hypothetical protein MKJ01_03135 [Chryseobacterium sp. SSA4.19]|uniref:hypothetical protein n=1 Tax=Chryseobacterium sp. SSA4.19 TaxID=2919915 RepID=UPI001F4EA5EA|nr:hypothetical protein [Chryseobacterium sp. SSA4.19]MCJ8152758.1 hypothetical protein [Chryseobacterium sp. SSA4.19]